MVAPFRRIRMLSFAVLLTSVAAVISPGSGALAGAADDDRFHYVALGDSYAAGQSLAPYGDRAVDRACRRSASRSYPLLLDTGVSGPLQTSIGACGGAQVADIADRSQVIGDLAVDPQIAMLDDTVDLVTITIGGNDLEYTRALYFCAFRNNCADAVYDEDSGATLREWSLDRLRRLGPELTEAYRAIDAESGDARIVAVGYPRLFSERSARFCFERFFFGTSERVFFAQVAEALDVVTAASAAAAGIEYVSVIDDFRGSEACGRTSARYEYMTGLSLGGTSIVDPSSFHPTSRGARAYAEIISDVLAA